MANEKYTTVELVADLMGERHAVNTAIERSGGVITDADVIASIEEVIRSVSRELDGYLRGHVEVPFDDYATGNVSPDIEVMVRGYVAYRLWARRGRFDKDNPHNDEKKIFFERVTMVQRGRWRFDTASGKEVAQKPVRYETDRVADDVERKDIGRKFTDTSLTGFTNPQ